MGLFCLVVGGPFVVGALVLPVRVVLVAVRRARGGRRAAPDPDPRQDE
jgi:hypothetical protein